MSTLGRCGKARVLVKEIYLSQWIYYSPNIPTPWRGWYTSIHRVTTVSLSAMKTIAKLCGKCTELHCHELCSALQSGQWYRVLAKEGKVFQVSCESSSCLEESWLRRGSPALQVESILIITVSYVHVQLDIAAWTLQLTNATKHSIPFSQRGPSRKAV